MVAVVVDLVTTINQTNLVVLMVIPLVAAADGDWVPVVQLAVRGRAWVVDALGAGCAAPLGELVRWLLEGEDATVLGFAFGGDLAVLRPLCGGAALRQLHQFGLWCECELKLGEAQLPLPPQLRRDCRDEMAASQRSGRGNRMQNLIADEEDEKEDDADKEFYQQGFWADEDADDDFDGDADDENLSRSR